MMLDLILGGAVALALGVYLVALLLKRKSF
nr:potassium-transporting ATPase subunit F [Agaricicola taiwanensis]